MTKAALSFVFPTRILILGPHGAAGHPGGQPPSHSAQASAMRGAGVLG